MREWGKYKANPLKKHKKNLTRELKKPILTLGGVKNFMKKLRNVFLLVLAGLSLSGCGGSRNLTLSSGELTFKEVEEKMEYVLMSDHVKIAFYSVDEYGKFYYGFDDDINMYFKVRFDNKGEYVSYVAITSEDFYLISRGDNVYGEEQK